MRLASGAIATYQSGMLRIALAAALVCLATPAGAHCLSLPDGAASNYVDNRMAHMLCLQRELAQDTAAAAERSRIEAELGNIRIELERQHALILGQQARLSAWP